jgi:hypothetical protein
MHRPRRADLERSADYKFAPQETPLRDAGNISNRKPLNSANETAKMKNLAS